MLMVNCVDVGIFVYGNMATQQETNIAIVPVLLFILSIAKNRNYCNIQS